MSNRQLTTIECCPDDDDLLIDHLVKNPGDIYESECNEPNGTYTYFASSKKPLVCKIIALYHGEQLFGKKLISVAITKEKIVLIEHVYDNADVSVGRKQLNKKKRKQMDYSIKEYTLDIVHVLPIVHQLYTIAIPNNKDTTKSVSVEPHPKRPCLDAVDKTRGNHSTRPSSVVKQSTVVKQNTDSAFTTPCASLLLPEKDTKKTNPLNYPIVTALDLIQQAGRNPCVLFLKASFGEGKTTTIRAIAEELYRTHDCLYVPGFTRKDAETAKRLLSTRMKRMVVVDDIIKSDIFLPERGDDKVRQLTAKRVSRFLQHLQLKKGDVCVFASCQLVRPIYDKAVLLKHSKTTESPFSSDPLLLSYFSHVGYPVKDGDCMSALIEQVQTRDLYCYDFVSHFVKNKK